MLKILPILIGLCATPAIARTIAEQDQLIINPISATDFEVVETQDMGPGAFWCGAASYHERRMGRSDTDVLYIKSPRGPSVTQPGARGVVFTTDPAGLDVTKSTSSISIRRAGLGFKSNFARSLCRDAFTRATK